jgi:MOSC domain-containing protein YiiM
MTRHRAASTMRVVALHVWPADADVPLPRDLLDLTWSGAEDDRHAGLTMRSDSRSAHVYAKGTEIRNHRQLSLVSIDELAVIAEQLGIDAIEPGLIADNIALSGAPDLTALPRMTRLEFASGAVIMTGGVNNPCTIAGRMVARAHGTAPEKFPKAAWDRRGITGWVDRPGRIAVGDAVTVHPPG